MWRLGRAGECGRIRGMGKTDSQLERKCGKVGVTFSVSLCGLILSTSKTMR